MAKGFAKLLESHSRQVQDLEGAQAQEFLRLLKGLEDELRGRLASVSDSNDVLTYTKYLRIDGETKAAIAKLEKKLNKEYGVAQADASDLAIDHIGEEIGRLSQTFDGSALDVSLSAAKALADPGQMLLANHFESSVQRYGLDMLNQVRQRLLIGIRTGDSMGDMVKAVTGQQGPLQTTAKANGERLIRTEVSSAYGSAAHSGIVQAAKKVPGLKKVWLHVSSYICKTCIGLDGTERPMDGTWTIRIGKKTREIAHNPAHPNCTCRVSAIKPSWRKEMQNLGYFKKQDEERPSL